MVKIGQVLLGKYRVDQFIGAGGMGVVYQVWDLARDVPLAMKVLNADINEDPAQLRRFQREANELKRLSHPHIVPFYGFEISGETAFLLEGYIDGADLKRVLDSRPGKRLPIPEALIYLKAICPALGYAHANGVVHCDIKPSNVMIDRGGSIYLTDFGVARHVESTITSFSGAGTPGYMAPEQIRHAAVSPATDIYALGAMLFEMLTGRRPFRGDEKGSEAGGDTPGERVRYAHQYLPPPDPRAFNPAIPPALAQVILRALMKNPAQRYQNTREFFLAACQAAGLNPEQVGTRMTLPVGMSEQETQAPPPLRAQQPPFTPQQPLRAPLQQPTPVPVQPALSAPPPVPRANLPPARRRQLTILFVMLAVAALLFLVVVTLVKQLEIQDLHAGGPVANSNGLSTPSSPVSLVPTLQPSPSIPTLVPATNLPSLTPVVAYPEPSSTATNAAFTPTPSAPNEYIAQCMVRVSEGDSLGSILGRFDISYTCTAVQPECTQADCEPILACITDFGQGEWQDWQPEICDTSVCSVFTYYKYDDCDRIEAGYECANPQKIRFNTLLYPSAADYWKYPVVYEGSWIVIPTTDLELCTYKGGTIFYAIEEN